jgi:hypothetical protein
MCDSCGLGFGMESNIGKKKNQNTEMLKIL